MICDSKYHSLIKIFYPRTPWWVMYTYIHDPDWSSNCMTLSESDSFTEIMTSTHRSVHFDFSIVIFVFCIFVAIFFLFFFFFCLYESDSNKLFYCIHERYSYRSVYLIFCFGLAYQRLSKLTMWLKLKANTILLWNDMTVLFLSKNFNNFVAESHWY